MRAFVAIDSPPLERPVPDWLRPEDHLTLHFFEELSSNNLPAVVDSISKAVNGLEPFALEVRGVGAFPSLQRPRVLWAAIGNGSATLCSIVDRLRRNLSSTGLPVEDRPFVPHLTLGRIRSPSDTDRAKRFLIDPENSVRVWGGTTVREVVLKESELLRAGPRHTVRARVSLGSHSSGPSPP
jgi:RNA 2',3'-cyclic 3'-phosphodiesterase